MRFFCEIKEKVVALRLRLETTFARKNKENLVFLWFFARLFVPLQPLFASCDGELSTINLILE